MNLFDHAKNLFDHLNELLALELEYPHRGWDADPTSGEVLKEMRDLVADARRSAVRIVAAEHRLSWELERAWAEAGVWEAKSAVVGPEAARRALLRAREVRGLVEILEIEHAAAQADRETALDRLAVLEARLTRASTMQRTQQDEKAPG